MTTIDAPSSLSMAGSSVGGFSSFFFFSSSDSDLGQTTSLSTKENISSSRAPSGLVATTTSLRSSSTAERIEASRMEK